MQVLTRLLLACAVIALASVGDVALADDVPAASDDCTAKAIRSAHKAFTKKFRAGKVQDAFDALRETYTDCRLSPLKNPWIVNDLAFAAHKLGDDESCLEFLQGLARVSDSGKVEVPSTLSARIRKAVLHNVKLCSRHCSALQNELCMRLKGAAATQKSAKGNFWSNTCGIPGHENGVSVRWRKSRLPACLVIREVKEPSAKCASELVLIVQKQSGLHSEVISLPEASFMRDPDWCCGEAAISADTRPGRRGHIKISGGSQRACDGSTLIQELETFFWNGSKITRFKDRSGALN